MFSYRGEHRILDSYGVEPGLFGVSHVDEMLYLFDPLHHHDLQDMNQSDENIRELLVSLWTNFAKYGDPTPPGTTTISWAQVENSGMYLNISGTVPSMEKRELYENRMQFWSTVV